jgi:AcrR family transcriptional regulator
VEPRGAASRRRILDAAATVLAIDPAASIQDVADAAGVGRATVNRYFPSRADLTGALAVQAMAEAQRALETARLSEGPVAAALTRLTEALVPMGDRFRFLLRESHLEGDPQYLAAEHDFVETLTDMAERGRRSGDLAVDVPPAWLVDALGALVFAAWEAVHDGRIAARDAPHLVSRTLLHGIGTTAPR